MTTLEPRLARRAPLVREVVRLLVPTLAALLVPLAGTVAAAETPPPSGVVNLSSSASIEVPKDLMNVTLAATREGADAATVQAALKQALDTALTEARKAARPQQLEVQTGNFSLYPRYNPKGSGIAGWQGTAELVIEGRDMPGIGALVGRISTLAVARVGFGLSREQRERVEGEVTAQAIARYRARAVDVAKQFGYAGYALREISVGGNDQPTIQPMMMKARSAAAPMADDALPVEAGKALVTVTVNGTVQLTR